MNRIMRNKALLFVFMLCFVLGCTDYPGTGANPAPVQVEKAPEISCIKGVPIMAAYDKSVSSYSAGIAMPAYFRVYIRQENKIVICESIRGYGIDDHRICIKTKELIDLEINDNDNEDISVNVACGTYTIKSIMVNGWNMQF